MKKKIQRSMILVIVTTIVVAYAITIVFIYGKIRTLVINDVENEAYYVASVANLSGESYINKISMNNFNCRVTLIKKDGSVLFDTEEDAGGMESHALRPEFLGAVNDGEGSSIRKSDTLDTDMYYYAIRLDNGDVVRLSKPLNDITKTALEFLPVMFTIAALMVLLAFFSSGHAAASIVAPINKLNLDNPLSNKTYPELDPLLHRIDDSNKEKAALADMRKEFSANVSHELKTPLTSISGYAEIIRDGIVKPSDIPKFSDRIVKESNRLLSLINDIIKLSELDEGKVEAQKENVDLFTLSRDIIERLSEKAQKNDIELSLSGEHCEVYGIRRILDEMIYNITDNAIKYNHKGGHVSIWAGRDMSGVSVVVTDDGIGIPDDQQERIFERFYRVDKSRSKELGGTGLGLSIVKHGAELHHAKVTVQSKVGEGTKMAVNFDIKR